MVYLIDLVTQAYNDTLSISVHAVGPEEFFEGGVTYVRWGMHSCPSGAKRVYNGLVGGGWFTGDGGSSSLICLPLDVQYVDQTELDNDGKIYSTEYETDDRIFTGTDTQDYDVPCAVCQVSHSSVYTTAGTLFCSSSDASQYKGYLMTSETGGGRKSTDYICVDADADYLLGSQANTDGAQLSFVGADCSARSPMTKHCGDPPIENYIQKLALTCAVCSA